jgi:hypothetical protein
VHRPFSGASSANALRNPGLTSMEMHGVTGQVRGGLSEHKARLGANSDCGCRPGPAGLPETGLLRCVTAWGRAVELPCQTQHFWCRSTRSHTSPGPRVQHDRPGTALRRPAQRGHTARCRA